MGILWQAIKNSKNKGIFILIVIAMILSTLASQLEMFAIGIITQKGPDFFELFASPASESVNFKEVATRWIEIVPNLQTPITPADALRFSDEQISQDTMGSLFKWADQTLGIRQNLWRLAIFLLFVALFKAVTMFFHRYYTKIASVQISRDLRQQYFEHIQALPMNFYQQHSMGSLSSRIVGDASEIAEALNACFINYLQTPFILISTLIICFLTSWQLTLLIFLGFPLIMMPILFLSKGVKRISKQIQLTQEKFSSVLLDFIGGIQTVKMFAMEEFSLKKYQEHNSKMASLEKRSARYDLSTRPIVHTLAMIFLSIALVYGLYVLHMPVSEVLFYCGMLYLFYEPVKKFAEETSHIQKGIAAAERLLEVMEIRPEIIDEPGAIPLTQFKKAIEFRHAWFAYNEHPILKGVSFTIKKGEQVAIVGPTGSGKSTIVQLIPRLYELQKGEILIDDLPIQKYTQRSIRDQISFVPQRPFLFMDTIASNIAFGRAFTEEEIKNAAKRAHASEFIDQLPEQYETAISEGGRNFSGGQQQRLAIARALIKKGAILILDEATSSLDAVSENYIKETLQDLKGEMTQIIIAHRLSTIQDADKIIFIEQGIKLDEGTKDELLERCAPFRRMWELLHQNEKYER